MSRGSHRRTASGSTYRQLFAIGEFRALWAAWSVSLIGDQLARVALALLVFDRTRSPLLTGLVYALSMLPQFFGGTVLGGLADRLPRRTVMIVCDVLRVALVLGMAVPGMPLAALCLFLIGVGLLEGLFTAARGAMMPDVLAGDLYVFGSAVSTLTFQVAMVVGFAAGGVTVGFIGAHSALLADAATFGFSALLVAAWVRRRPAAVVAEHAERLLTSFVAGARLVFRDPRLRTLTSLAWLWTLLVVPEGLAVPYAAHLGYGAFGVGALLAATPGGTAIGSVLLPRLASPGRRLQLLAPLALLAAAPPIVCFLHPGLTVSALLFALSGVGCAYNLPANAAFVAALPDERRGQAFGLVSSGMLFGQGLGILAAGALAQTLAPATVVGIAAVLGTVVVALLWRGCRVFGEQPERPAVIDLTEAERLGAEQAALAEVQAAQPTA
jgi:MFS family permease